MLEAILIILGGITNRIRGGWLGEIIPGGTQVIRILYSIFLTSIICFSTNLLYIFPFVCILMVSFFTILFGWGSYFDMGRNNLGYKDNPEFLPSDISIRLIMGKDWIPNTDTITKENWLREKSPTGMIRSYKWRVFRDLIGMSIRGLAITIPIGLIYFYFSGIFSLYFMISGILMSLIYLISWHIPSSIKHFETGPEIAEIIWGGYIIAAVLFLL